MNDLVSIIIPTKDRPDSLIKAIDSIFSQTYEYFEIILISDGNSDKTNKLIDKYFSNSEKIKIIYLKSSVGAAEARNIGINKSQGDYIAFLDDDDTWEKTKLKKQLNVFNMFSDTAIVSCFYNKNENGKLSLVKSNTTIDKNQILYINYPGSFSFCMIKKKDLSKIVIPKFLNKAQDWYLWISILTSSNKKCRIIPEPLVTYNTEAENRITQKNIMSHFKRIEFYREIWGLMNKKQRLYNLRVLMNEKNSVSGTSILLSYRLSLFSLKLHISSRYNITFYELFRNLIFLKKIFKKKTF